MSIAERELTWEQLEKDLGVEKPFSSSTWLAQTIAERGLNEVDLTSTTFARKKTFREICKKVTEQLQDLIVEEAVDSIKETNMNWESQTKENIWLERQHRAIIGDESAMNFFIIKINEVLQNENITSNDYPSFYGSLAEAVFHEVWGMSILHKWDKIPRSEAAVIRGTELWIDVDGTFVKQREEFESEEVVERIKRAFRMRVPDAIINEQNPELEIEREDGSRITMIQKPRSRENYIMFRRFIVKNLSLEEQARLETIPMDDVPFYRALSRTMPNIIVAGPVRSAKSTFMKTLIGVRDRRLVGAVMEKHFELDLSRTFRDRLFYEVQAKEGDLHHAMPRLLRMEHDFIVVGEIRSLETEGFLQACERGQRGAISSYHLTEEDHAVEQITRHILDEFPNRNFDNELQRVARNIDFIITMRPDRDRKRKRVTGVTEIIWDSEKQRYRVEPIIRYSPVTGKYYYSSNISNRLLVLMAEQSLEDTKIVVQHLKRKEKESPMSEYEKDREKLIDELIGVGF